VVAGLTALLPAAAVLIYFSAQDAPKTAQIFFSKSFPGSSPAYIEIQLEETGKGTYREATDDDRPLRFELTGKETKEIFALAEKVQFFQKPLESKLKVANMGLKTLRYQQGGTRGEVKFNYTEDLDARALVDWFEKISETEQHLINLERAAKFDRLGVNKALLLLETSWNKNRIVAPEQLLPILERIVAQKVYLHMAQVRAASLVERIRAGSPQN